MPAVLDLIELVPREKEIRIDTQGERKMTIAETYLLASRLIDLALAQDGEPPLDPFHDQIVVRLIEESEWGKKMTAGGVVMPDSVNEQTLRGVVCAVGPRANQDGNGPRVGDIISFARSGGYVTKVGTDSYLTMKSVYAFNRILLDERHPQPV